LRKSPSAIVSRFTSTTSLYMRRRLVMLNLVDSAGDHERLLQEAGSRR
jgi:hypothetical protein